MSTIQKAIDLGPTKAQNSSLYSTLQRLRSNIIVDKDVQERAQADKDEGERARQEAIREAARKARINYIHRLSPDVLLSIAEHGSVDQPGFVSKMAGVCKSWRGILVNQKGLWTKLVLGKRRVTDKVKTFTERTEGKIMEISITVDFDTSKTEDVAKALRSVLKTVRRLTIISDKQTIETLLHRWKGRFRHLEYLNIQHVFNPARAYDIPVSAPDIVCGLLDGEASSLRHLQLDGLGFSQKKNGPTLVDTQATAVSTIAEEDEVVDPVRWTDQPLHLASIRNLSLVRCIVVSAWPDLSDLVRHTPLLTTFTTEQTTTLPMPDFSDWVTGWQARGRAIILPNLNSYSATSYTTLIQFADVTVPALQYVDLWKASPFGLSDRLAAHGLNAARPSLTSLDLGHCVLDQNELLGVLAKLPGLKFLNVSYCALDNTFLDALQRKGNPETDLLPNLTALSIAGNLEITSGSLRHLVLSRLPGGLKRTRSISSATSSTRGSAFRPKAPPSRVSPFAPSRPKPATVIVAPIPARAGPTSAVAQPPSSSSHDANMPSIMWLCIDHCERIESEAPDALRKKVRFVSHNLSAKPTEMRIRGKGRWAWDAEFTGDCGQGESGCMLRRTPGECLGQASDP